MKSNVPAPLAHADDEQLLDSTVLVTPKPRACSTVNRRSPEPFSPLNNVLESDQPTQSPSYLLNAIAGVRRLTDQLGNLHKASKDSLRMPRPTDKHLHRASSVSELRQSHRESLLTESEANSSLGILKLDSCHGFSEPENAEKAAEVFAKFRKEFMSKTPHNKENLEPRNELLSGIGSTGSNLNHGYSPIKSRTFEADLKLRLQRELAQRTINRSVESVRLSQLGDSFNVDSELSLPNDNDVNQFDSAVEAKFSNSQQTQSSASHTTFGAANFMSFGSPPAIDSLGENFQSADLAMDRLQQDENSWRRHFDDLPVLVPLSNEIKIIDDVGGHAEHLTPNLDVSEFSGIVAGDITVSSSMGEDIGKRRLSAGEYFQFHTEKLGAFSDDQRPNFGNSIRSPPKRRPHPPLVSLSNSSDLLDDVPTRDAGLTLAESSIIESLNLSLSMNSDFGDHETPANSEDNPGCRSVDLMPPPPPRLKALPHGSRTLNTGAKDSIASRLSVSLSIPKGETMSRDMNSSSLSLDSGEKFLSISQIVNLMNEKPAEPKTARQLVDEFLQRCQVPSQTSKPQHSGSLEKLQSVQEAFNPDIKGGDQVKADSYRNVLKFSPEQAPSRDQRVKAWISDLNNLSRKSSNENNVLDHSGNSLSLGTEPKITRNHSFDLRDGCKKFLNTKSDVSTKLNSAPEGDELNESFIPSPSSRNKGNLEEHRLCSTPKVFDAYHDQESNSRLQKIPRESFESFIDNAIKQIPKNVERLSLNSEDSDLRSSNSQGSHYRTSSSKTASWKSMKSPKSSHQRTISNCGEFEKKVLSSDGNLPRKGVLSRNENRPQSVCGSAKSSTRGASRQADAPSTASGPLQIESTHSQLSWASVSPSSSVSQTFALRNKASARVRLLVSSPNASFKLMGERGEVLSELVLTLHSEETRRIHVVFTPISIGSVIGKLVICRVATSDSAQYSTEDRRLIALYGYGGVAEIAVDGASKDLWAQLFLNMCSVDSAHRDTSDIDTTGDAPQMVASFTVRNCGKVPAFISLQVAAELPFSNCGVYISPSEMSLIPGEGGQVMVHFDPDQDVLQWLSKNAADMQLLSNIWISWSELATWQRIRRVFLKYYKIERTGPMSTWGPLYNGDVGVGRELKDNKSSEAVLTQAVRRLKIAVLIERERLSLFDLDTTMIFDQLLANETAMFNSPQWNEKTLDTTDNLESPIPGSMTNQAIVSEGSNNVFTREQGNNASPVSSTSRSSRPTSRKLPEVYYENELVVITNEPSGKTKSFSLGFPQTNLRHKSKINLTFQNPTSKNDVVSIGDLSQPFTISTSHFTVSPSSYFTISIFFKPMKPEICHSSFNVYVNGKLLRTYFLKGEGVLS